MHIPGADKTNKDGKTDERRAKENGLAAAAAAISERFSSLLRLEIELALLEVKSRARKLAFGVALLVAAGLLAFVGFSLGLVTIILAATASEAWWLTLLIISGCCFLGSMVSGIVGLGALKKGAPVPKQALEEAQLTKESLRAP